MHQWFKDLDSNPDFLRDLGFLSGPLFLKLISFEIPYSSAWNYDQNVCCVVKELERERAVSKAKVQAGQ